MKTCPNTNVLKRHSRSVPVKNICCVDQIITKSYRQLSNNLKRDINHKSCICSIKLDKTMLSRTLCRTVPHLSNLFRPTRSARNCKYSDSSSSSPTDPDAEIVKSGVAELLEDAASYNEIENPNWATLPYPQGAPARLQGAHAVQPRIDPTETSLILFPGQGTLKVGAIKEYLRFPRVKDLFELANEALGYDLLQICLKGPQQVLDRTEYNQPATVITSLAALEKLREERPRAIEDCVGTAGYSVGEFSALIFAGALTVESGIRLVGVRGAAMQAAAEKAPQGMMSVYCPPQAKVSEACKKAETWALDLGVDQPQCRVAIFLHPQGKVLAGNEEALQYIRANSKTFGLRNLRNLPVSGAFHTHLMMPALRPFKQALETVELHKPIIPVYSNIDGKRYRNTEQIAKFLPKQIISPVKWEQTMHILYERPQGAAFPRTFDLGSGGAMKYILKLVNAKAWDSCYVV